MNLFIFIISFGASVIGAICGIGGGVIIKPTLDALHVLSVSTISFLSGITVLSMSCYSISNAKLTGDYSVNMKKCTPLAIGAAAGGIIGKIGFEAVSNLFADKEIAGAVQAFCLLIMTISTLVYVLKKDSIKTRHTNSLLLSLAIGLVLGILSSFLGIGGGPINLVVLYYFFSMETKEAAQNSLYIILFSQITSLLITLVTGNVPEFKLSLLLLMIAGGILGAVTGRIINKRISSKVVDKLFIILMLVIILINIYNIYQFM